MSRTSGKVLYIAGWGRSGTTILDNLLGQVEGIVSTGELRLVWQFGLIENRPCGCGTPLRECDFWQEVFRVGFGGFDAARPDAVIESQRQLRARYARRILRASRHGDILRTYPYAQAASQLYQAIATVSGARVIVDSSKHPTGAILAAGLADREVYVLHMVRDPRAVAHSWQRRKVSPGKTREGGLLTRVGPAKSAVVWSTHNAVTSRYARRAVGDSRYLLVQYERFAADPSAVLTEVVDFLDEQPTHTPTFDGHRVKLGVSHTAFGNPNRLATGSIDIHLDDEWRRAMPKSRRRLVTALSYPMLRSLKYQ